MYEEYRNQFLSKSAHRGACYIIFNRPESEISIFMIATLGEIEGWEAGFISHKIVIYVEYIAYTGIANRINTWHATP